MLHQFQKVRFILNCFKQLQDKQHDIFNVGNKSILKTIRNK